MLCGLLGVAANQLFFFHGLNLTSPIDASIIIILLIQIPPKTNYQKQYIHSPLSLLF